MGEHETKVDMDNKKTKIDWSDKTILIAEDEEINYFFLKESLEDTHANIIHAKNGHEAVECIKSDKVIDAVLMDIKMPIMNGYEATELIRKIDTELPIIAQTAFTLSGEKKKCFELGCNDFINKPIKPKFVIEVLSKYLG